MANQNSINKKNLRRRNRSKKTSRFNPNRLRMVIYRSLKHFEVQIIDDFKGNTTHFFGDMMEVGGNDYSLAQVVSKCYPVEDWKQTKKYLKELIKNDGWKHGLDN